MTFKEYCKFKYAHEDDGLSLEEYNVMIKVIDKGADTDNYNSLTNKGWHEWFSYWPDQKRFQSGLDKLYLKYIQRENL